MDNKLSKPYGYEYVTAGRGHVVMSRTLPPVDMREVKPLYSQEYVSVLLAELEEKDKCIAEAEVRGVEKLAAAFKSWASDETFPDYEAQRHWATASQESLSFAEDLRNGGCDDR